MDNSRLSQDLQEDKRVTLNKKHKNEIFTRAAFTSHVLFIDQHQHGRTIMFMVTDSSMMVIGHYAKIFDP